MDDSIAFIIFLCALFFVIFVVALVRVASKNNELEQDLREKDRDLTAKKKEISDLQDTLSDLKNELDKCHRQNSIQQNAITDLEKKLDEYHRQVQAQMNTIGRLSEQLQELAKENEQLTGRNRELTKDVEFYANIKAASKELNDAPDDGDLSRSDLDEEQSAAFNLMMNTDQNLFITGKAGTGKSALLRVFAKETTKCILKLAPTGIAAMNIQGVTLHSAFGFFNLVNLSYDDINRGTLRLNSDKWSVLASARTIIIDEISMVRSDVLEKIDRILQLLSGNTRPFGGKQMILFGDIFQLPPIAKREERLYLNDVFGGIHFFNAPAYRSGNFRFIELTINHRQTTDAQFFEILNEIRDGTVSDEQLALINTRTEYEPGDLRVVTRLFSKKAEAEAFNHARLTESPGKEFVSKARILFPEEGTYPTADNGKMETNFPITEYLRLKKGALVMFVKNNGDHWANGTLGIVSEIYDDKLRISVNNEEFDVTATEFEQLEATYVNGKIAYRTACRVSQYPVVLAYAMTIHKAQGQTYGKIACDVSDCFAPGQAYVALSRIRNLSGLFLLSKVYRHQIQIDTEAKAFYYANKYT